MSSLYKGLTAPDYADSADAPFAFRELIDSGPVARFANASARDLAIPSPTTGNIIYRLDTKVIEIFNGLSWASVNPALPPVHQHHSPLGTEADGITGVHGSKITNGTIPISGSSDKLTGTLAVSHIPSTVLLKSSSPGAVQVMVNLFRSQVGSALLPAVQIGVEDLGFYRTSEGALGIAYGNAQTFEFNGASAGGFGSPSYHSGSGFMATGKVGMTYGGVSDGGLVAAIRAAGAAGYFGRLSNGSTVEFYRSNVLVGSISLTASTTAYNTSSDNRQKENIQDLTPGEAMNKIMSLEPRTFDWKTDGSRGIGLIAQEAFVVYEEPVYVPDDPEEMQAIDYSKYVTLLIAAVQHLSQRIDALTV